MGKMIYRDELKEHLNRMMRARQIDRLPRSGYAKAIEDIDFCVTVEGVPLDPLCRWLATTIPAPWKTDDTETYEQNVAAWEHVLRNMMIIWEEQDGKAGTLDR